MHLCGMLKSQQGVRGIDDILSVIQSEIKTKTKKFEFFMVEIFGDFLKKTPESREYLNVVGIMKAHSLKLCNDNIIVSEWTCTCSVQSTCTCSSKKSINKAKIVKPAIVEFVEKDVQSEELVDNEELIQDSDDNGQTDISDDSDRDEGGITTQVI